MTTNTQEALASGRELIIKHKLPLKILKCASDEAGLHFAYISPEKTDLRPLSRELNRHFKVKISLEELNVEEAAKLIPGYGPCGTRLCWATDSCENLWPCKFKEADETSKENPSARGGRVGVETTKPQDHQTTGLQSGVGESTTISENQPPISDNRRAKKKKLVRRLVLK